MLKFLLGFLLLANLVLLASNAGVLGAGSRDGHEPNRAANQLNAQRILLVDPAPGGPAASSGSVTSGAAGATLADSAGAGATGTAGANGAVPAAGATATAGATGTTGGGVATAPSSDPVVVQCVEIGNFDAAEAARFATVAAPLVPPERLARRSVQEIERYIVYIPPLADKESAERKAAELRRLGIDDFFIFNESSDLRYGISLGLFKTAEAANQQLAGLVKKGVRSARVTGRTGATSKTVFQLRGLDAQAQAALTRIRASFPRQETRACAPA